MRVIAGSLRGRRLRVPRGRPVRPTYDRVRESVFGILEPEIEGARVLDLYAGSGSLGIECLSRGAAHATFVEADRAVAAVLRANVETLGLAPRAAIVRGDVAAFLRGRATEEYDLVLADPPYAGGLARSTAGLLARWNGVRDGSIVVIEHGGEDPLEGGGGLRRWRSERYGGIAVDFFEVRAADPTNGDEP